MKSSARCVLYENREIRDVTGETIRPGGFVLTDRAQSICRFPPGARVLDVGCGMGATVQHLSRQYHLNAVGVDPSPLLLQLGRNGSEQVPLLEAAGENLPFLDEDMDGVFAECTLSLMDEDQALAEFFRVLKPGGYLVVADIYARNSEGVDELQQLPVVSCLTGAMPAQRLIRKIQVSGFEIVLWEDQSRLLAELTARLIFANSSPAAFWGAMCQTGDCSDIQHAVHASKPGYFLLIAKKPLTRHRKENQGADGR
ncbi:methyltransferase domain-containing protein [Alicyclobacillus tolerans]|uniref:DVU_1556 family methyltransferase n=1 Tax=Alicyclobacillus tolerans TaxID=90970 RepID=UPI001F015763|nr:class I SAM-dependent methyltransferase [Alicyclobacillus tolerans]MCF8567241.1 methyltransferase domain-containing protein [Alicyclobacillus tolerans]